MNSTAAVPSGGATAGANVTADKAIEILLLFSPEAPVWTQQEISSHLNMSRSTTYRYISSLRATGLVVQDERGRFCLGPRLLHMAQAAKHGNPVIGLLAAPMRELSERFNEVVILNERIGQEILALERIESSHRIVLKSTRTHLLPWPATGSAKVLLAYADEPERSELFAMLVPTRYTKNTIASMDELREQLEIVRLRGYAISDEERDEDVWGVSVPLLQNGKCHFALSLVGPKFRMSSVQRTEMIEAMVQVGTRVSGQMG